MATSENENNTDGMSDSMRKTLKEVINSDDDMIHFVIDKGQSYKAFEGVIDE